MKTIKSIDGKVLTFSYKLGNRDFYTCPEGELYWENGISMKDNMMKVGSRILSSFKDFDEEYHCACLNCKRVVMCGPPCCDNFLSQSMVDEGNVK